MIRQSIFSRNTLGVLLSCCICLGYTACVNQVDDDSEVEIEEGSTPITFSIKLEKEQTRVTDTAFEEGDRVGLFATTSSNSITGKRYIDNLALEYTGGSSLTPKKTVFYPEGNVPLDFISYHPYRTGGVPAGSSILPVSVQPDQRSGENRSSSDFLVAETENITSGSGSVLLEFRHKMAKLSIILEPDENHSAEDLLEDNPHIIASGMKTSADYNLEDGSFSNLGEAHDIIPYGEWRVKDGKLVGKEFIIIPQTLSSGKHSFIMEWNGRIYSCAIPDLEMNSSTQCNISISAMQSTSSILNSFAGTISDWSDITASETGNTEPYSAIHTSAITFSSSGIYRVYHEGMAVAEICKEYLRSARLTSEAVIVYPLDEDETADLSRGIVLTLSDSEEPICGGTINWHTDDYGFTYTEGESAGIERFYLDSDYNILLDKPENPIRVNVACHTLKDFREKSFSEYPLVKIGRQYWMGSNLSATAYRDGTPLELQTVLGPDNAGYFHPRGTGIYFYNGEAVLAGELAPDGWKIPSNTDWEQLEEYIEKDVSVLKAGEWQIMVEGDEVAPALNKSGFNALPVGMWLNATHYSPGKMVAYWSWDAKQGTLYKDAFYLLGEENEFVLNPSKVNKKEYYKSLAIRCIKE